MDYSTIKSLIYHGMYSPPTWPSLAATLDVLFSGNATAIAAQLMAGSAVPPVPAPDADAIIGIKCSDKLVRQDTLEEAMPGIEARQALSRIGGDIADFSAIQCARWEMDAKERYQGDFQVKPANPILLISTSADPITPLVSAKNMSAGFEGSVVLEQGGFGVSH